MKKTATLPVKRRRRGRPPAEHKLEKLIAYMPHESLVAAKNAARRAGARSLSSWAASVLEREASRLLRTGIVPLWVLDMPSGSDPTGSVRKAIREERDSGW